MHGTQELAGHIRANATKSVLLLVGFPFVLPTIIFAFVLLAAAIVKHPAPLSIAATGFFTALAVMVVATLVWLPIGYMCHQWIIDQATGARLVERTEERRLWAVYERLCASVGMRMPALRIIESDVMNAFASGLAEGRYSVTVTRGLLRTLEDDELEGVLAHELTHIRNQDVRLLVIATVLVGMIPLLHDIIMRIFWALVTAFLKLYQAIFTLFDVPIARLLFTLGYAAIYWAGWVVARVIGIVGHLSSLIIHFALSRAREFMADAGAVEMTGKPEALISALRKVSGNCGLETSIDGVREMLFDSPSIFGISGLFATHPPIEKRIQAIAEKMAHMRHEPERQNDGPEMKVAPRRPSATHVAPDPSAAAYRNALRRAMNGSPAALSSEQRNAVYERARLAIEKRRAQEPASDEKQIEQAYRTLEQLIEEIEAEVQGC
jgi:heat shock protein HtpX